MNSRIHSQVVVARLCRSFCSAKAKCLQAHAHMQVHEGDKLKVIRFPRSSTAVTTPTSTSVTSADVNMVFSGFAVHLHSRSLPVKTTSTERAADAPRNRVSEQAAGIKCGVLDWHCVTNHFLAVREGDITQSRAKSLVLLKLQLRQSCRWNVTVFAENVSDSITQVRWKVRLTLGSQEIDPDHVSVMSVKATNLKSYGFLVLCNSFNSNSRSVTSAGVNTLTLDSQCVPIRRSCRRYVDEEGGLWLCGNVEQEEWTQHSLSTNVLVETSIPRSSLGERVKKRIRERMRHEAN